MMSAKFLKFLTPLPLYSIFGQIYSTLITQPCQNLGNSHADVICEWPQKEFLQFIKWEICNLVHSHPPRNSSLTL